MLNHTVLAGRLIHEPELRRTPLGRTIASFTLAINQDCKNKQHGSTSTDIVDVVALNGTAEFVSKHFTKGHIAEVEGHLRMRSWQDGFGCCHHCLEVIADSVRCGADAVPTRPIPTVFSTLIG